MNTVPNRNEAEETVFENLGMTKEELGVVDTEQSEPGSGNEGEGAEGSEVGSGNDDGVPERSTERQYDDLDAAPRQAQNKQQPADFRQFPKNAPVKPDKHGNLIDPGTGRIVAKAGKEARLYTERHNARVAAARAESDVREINTRLEKAIEIGQGLHQEVQRLNAQNEQIQRLGLQPTEMLQAAQFAAEAKSNPVGVLKRLLTMAAAQGIDLTQLGMPAGTHDPKSLMDMIKQEISQHLKPVTDRAAAETTAQQKTQAETQEKQQVEGQIRSFFSENPEARKYYNVFMSVYSNPRLQHMSLGEAWARIQLNLARNGTRTNGQRSSQPSLPNGRGRPQTGPNAEIAPVNASYDQIINGLLTNVR